MLVFFTLALVFTGLTWILFKQKNSWLLEELKTFVNESQSGRLEIGTMELNILGSFPDLGVLFRHVYYYPATTDTVGVEPILQANQVAISLEIIPLLREQVYISELSIVKGQLRLSSDSVGRINLIEALAPPKKPASPSVQKPVKPIQPNPIKPKATKPTLSTPSATVQIDLQQVLFTDFNFFWQPFQSDTTHIVFQHLAAELDNTSDTLVALIHAEHELQKIVLSQSTLSLGEGSFSVGVKYAAKTKSVTLQEGSLNQNGIEATVHGYSNFDGKEVELFVDARVYELEFLKPLFHSNVLRGNPNLLKHGRIFFSGKAFGTLDYLQVAATFGARDISWKVPGKSITFEGLGFNGQFESGAKPDFSQAKLTLEDIRGKLPGGYVNGYFRLNNFNAPYISYDLNLNANLSGYDEVFNLSAISALKGEIDLQTKYSGPVKTITKQDSSRATHLKCKDVSFYVNHTRQQVTDLNVTLETKNGVTVLQPLSFNYGKNQLRADLTFDQNLLLLLINRESGVRATGHIVAPVVYTQDLLFDTLQQAQVQDRISDLQLDFDAAILVDSSKQQKQTLELTVSRLSAQFEELPNIKNLEFKSRWSSLPNGLQVEVNDFRAALSQGEIILSGGLSAYKDKWDFNADLNVNQFPWTYVRELTAELQEGREPKEKNMLTDQMDRVTATGKISASIVPYPFDITQSKIEANRIVYEAPGNKPIQAEGVSLQMDSLLFTHPENSGAISGILGGAGNATIRKLVLPAFTMRNVESIIHGFQDTLQLDFKCVTQKSKTEHGVLQLSVTNPVPVYNLAYKVDEADLSSFLQQLFNRRLVDGKINYLVQLKSAGRDWASLKRNTFGTIEISSQGLVLYGIDVDNVLKRYEKSQNFNLTDVGAVLVAGPIGLAVTKGTDFISLAAIKLDSGHQTQVDTLYARWSLEQLQLRTQDVAFTTPLNRIAIQGQIDLLKDSIPGITVAVVDKKGCSLMDQKLSGKFSALETGKLNITKTLFGSVINFVNAMAGVNCTPVYSGQVNHPN